MNKFLLSAAALALGLNAHAAKLQQDHDDLVTATRQQDTQGIALATPTSGHRHIDGVIHSAPMPRENQLLKYNEQQAFVRRSDKVPVTKLINRTAAPLASAVTAACENIDEFASRSGSALADYIVSLPDYECTYVLFSGTTSAQAKAIYSDANITAIANRLQSLAASYDATRMDIGNLILVLRAGYYTVSARPETGLTFPGVAAHGAVKNAIAAMLNSPNLFNYNAAHSRLANELFTLISNAQVVGDFFARMPAFVRQFTNSGSAPNAADELKTNQSAALGLTGVLTIFYRAQWDAVATTARETDTSYSQALVDFIRNNKSALSGSSADYQLTDTSNEAWRFMAYSTTQFNYLKPKLQTVLSENSWNGGHTGIWMAAASAVKWYDNANCTQYNNACNAEKTVADGVLVNNYSCSSTIKIRAQQMSATELQQSCALMAAEETYFHKMLQTNNTAVANDNNTVLEVVVFDDYSNYGKYAGFIYDIATDNGGMYLEGDPSVAGNQARFIAHEASWLRPQFSVWNLEHEYIHYLDGRFDMKGDFGDGTVKPTVWWIEGVAEYLSYKNNNQKAIDKAKTNKYLLSTIFGNTYSMSDYSDRAYPWGYMSVRFMNERHRADIDAILPKFRAGDYEAYQRYMTAIGTRYDSEFQSWAAQATTAGNPPEPAGSATALSHNVAVSASGALNSQTKFYIDVPSGQGSLTVAISGGSGDADLYIKRGSEATLTSYDYRPYLGGNNETVSINNPAAGRYYVMLHGYSAYANTSLLAKYTAPTLPECASTSQLSNGCKISNLAVTTSGHSKWIAVWIPTGAKNLQISTSGGTGNADIYLQSGAWPSTTSYQYRSINAGNSESVTVATPTGNSWYYINVYGTAPYSGVAIQSTWQ